MRLEPKDLKVVVAVPDFAVSTTAARRALPERVSHRDAAFNVGRSGLLLGALATGEYDLLRVAMQDRLHQAVPLPPRPRPRGRHRGGAGERRLRRPPLRLGPDRPGLRPRDGGKADSIRDAGSLRDAGRRGKGVGARR